MVETTIHQRSNSTSTSDTTVTSLHSCNTTHVESRRVVVDGSAGEAPAVPENKEGSQLEGAGDIQANDDDSLVQRTYQFDNCHVYMNSFNARGIKVKDSGNDASRVTRMSHINEAHPSSSKSSTRLNTRPKGPRNHPAFGQSFRHQGFSPDSAFTSPPLVLPFELTEDSSSYTSDDPPVNPPVRICSEQGQPPVKKDKLTLS